MIWKLRESILQGIGLIFQVVGLYFALKENYREAFYAVNFAVVCWIGAGMFLVDRLRRNSK